jgi:hypothetical protein
MKNGVNYMELQKCRHAKYTNIEFRETSLLQFIQLII